MAFTNTSMLRLDEKLWNGEKVSVDWEGNYSTMEHNSSISPTGDRLFVDGVLVFSLNDGLIRSGLNASNSALPHHGW